MKRTGFFPGFRFSVVDAFVLVGGTATTVILSLRVWWWGFVLGFVLAHFFLFCNIIRMARPLELLWAGVFVVLESATISFETPGWLVTILVSLLVTLAVVIVELRKPSYHGAGWRLINPNLRDWWNSHRLGGTP